MRMPMLPLLLTVGISICLQSCIPSNPKERTQPQGLLYRCIGVAPYEPGALDGIIAFEAKNPPICVDGVDKAFDKFSLKTASQTDSMSVTMYVMDSKCKFVEEAEFKAPEQSGPYSLFLFRGKTKEGKAYETGEYYVNYTFDHPGKGSDTSYTKMGWVRDRCAP